MVRDVNVPVKEERWLSRIRTSGANRHHAAASRRRNLRDQDDEALVTQELDYACGCRSIRHEYHDGSVSRKVIHHDGDVLVDELVSAE